MTRMMSLRWTPICSPKLPPVRVRKAGADQLSPLRALRTPPAAPAAEAETGARGSGKHRDAFGTLQDGVRNGAVVGGHDRVEHIGRARYALGLFRAIVLGGRAGRLQVRGLRSSTPRR